MMMVMAFNLVLALLFHLFSLLCQSVVCLPCSTTLFTRLATALWDLPHCGDLPLLTLASRPATDDGLKDRPGIYLQNDLANGYMTI